jgi:AcrR family transcriptional regulator
MAAPDATRPRRVRLEHDARRRQILASARERFTALPYSEVSMQGLADAAGVARGLLHHYFGSKRELYLEVVRELVRTPTVPVPDLAGLSREEVWERSVDTWLDHVEANRDLWLDSIGAGAAGRDPEVEAIIEEGREAVARRSLLAVGVDPRTAAPEVLAVVRGFGGLAQEVTREWLERERLDRAQARVLLVGALPLLLDRLLPAIDPAPHR